MRIVIDARESGTSTGRYIDKLVEYLAKLKSDHEFLVLAKPPRLDYLRSVAPDFELVQCDIREFSIAEQTKLKRQIKGLKPDLVHFGMVQQPAGYRGKVVTTMHDLTTTRFKDPTKNWLVFRFKQRVYKWLCKRVAKKSVRIITPTEFVRRDVASFAGVDPAKITVTYEAADKIVDAPEQIKTLAGKKFILFVGRAQPHKNLQRLVEAFEQLSKNHPDLKLVLAGKIDSNYKRVEKFAQSRNLTSQVIFTDYVSAGELKWLYQNCQAYVFPSLSEGFGLPGLEAMAEGAPVASSKATCLPEVYSSAAHYFDPLSMDDMATKIGQVLDGSKLRAELIAKGQAQAAKYSWAHMAQQTLDVYDAVTRKS